MAELLSGKVALVTGSASGIGRATALACAREGAKTVVSDVDVAGGGQTVGMIESAGGEAIFVRADVTADDEVAALVQMTVAAYGQLDCAFNNAGIECEYTHPEQRFTEETFHATVDTNLKGVWLCMKYEIQQMLSQGGGTIVNTASAAGLVGFPGLPDYVASKHGVVGLTKTAALEYAKSGIRVNAVCPGVIQTPMVERGAQLSPGFDELAVSMEPVGRFGQPSEVGEAVVWLCSDAASFVTGIPMQVDGGLVAQ
jgi:NAD(P)-dependent dehydrogenase (short-subunit alcohol dehydrogenase family)